jgi:hypothetical protein
MRRSARASPSGSPRYGPATAGNGPTGRDFAGPAGGRRCYSETRTVRYSTPLILAMLLAAPAAAQAQPTDDTGRPIEPAPRRHDASWREIFSGPFRSSRLFAMPTAQVVGAYQISLSGDASLLTLEDALSATSVVALGFGDIAQLEYRNAAAISSLEDDPLGLPTVGVQLRAPIPPHRYVPDLAVALRFGLPKESSDGAIQFSQRATDLYLVGRLPLWGSLDRITLHGGVRFSQAEITSDGGPEDVDEILILPAGGLEARMTDDTDLVAELALVPQFSPGSATVASQIDAGVFGRAGIRWRLLPSVIFDASVGYRIEIERLAGPSSMPSALVDWDIRLGGELFVPWGAMACKTVRIFCE